jgi:hypothetical protein
LVFDFVLRPARAAVRVLNEDAVRPLEQTEREMLDAVMAIEHATESIEHHVAVIESLATSVGPLTDSVNRLNETLRDLVQLLEPLAAAERETHHAEHEVDEAKRFLHFRGHKQPAESEAKPPEEG